MHLALLRRLFDHMEWADAFLWRTVLPHEAARADDYVLDGLTHLHLVQRAYLAVWTGRPVTPRSRDEFAGPEEIREWGRTYYPEAARFLDELSDERLADVIPIPWTAFIEDAIGAPPADATLGDLVLQVAMHSVHHRAQINRRLREVGAEPGLIDYVGWVWRGCPAPDWSD